MATLVRTTWTAIMALWGGLHRIVAAGIALVTTGSTEPTLAGPERRRFLSRAALAVAGAGAFFGALPAALGLGRRQHRWGMVIDLDRCSGCSACTIACRQENNIPILGPERENQGARIEWMSLLWQEAEEDGGMPEVVPFPCQHCERAPCTQVCPVGATYTSSEGFTAQIWDRCIGCRYCMAACPYARRSFNWKGPEWHGDLVQLLNPDVATRPRGVVEKCTLCHHRVQAAKERAALEMRELTDEELVRLPACAAACPARAITFGDRADPYSTVSRQIRGTRAFRLLAHLGTRPRVVYLKRDRRQ